jgi:hypothetical protein
MKLPRACFVRLGQLSGREQRDRELSAELESHVQMRIEENLRAGMTLEETHRQALIFTVVAIAGFRGTDSQFLALWCCGCVAVCSRVGGLLGSGAEGDSGPSDRRAAR